MSDGPTCFSCSLSVGTRYGGGGPKDLKKYGDPYSFPTAGKDLIWRLVPTKDGDRLYIRTTSRIYSSPTKWKVTELVFEPQD